MNYEFSFGDDVPICEHPRGEESLGFSPGHIQTLVTDVEMAFTNGATSKEKGDLSDRARHLFRSCIGCPALQNCALIDFARHGEPMRLNLGRLPFRGNKI